MRVTPDIICAEFIGTFGEVIKSNHAGYVGLNGPVISETRNTFTISDHGTAKRIVKNLAIFNFKFSDGTIVEIDGSLLVGRPEDRLKKSLKRLW